MNGSDHCNVNYRFVAMNVYAMNVYAKSNLDLLLQSLYPELCVIGCPVYVLAASP